MGIPWPALRGPLRNHFWKKRRPRPYWGGDNSGNALEASNALNYRAWGIPAVLLTGIPGKALRAFPAFRNFSGISSGKPSRTGGVAYKCDPQSQRPKMFHLVLGEGSVRPYSDNLLDSATREQNSRKGMAMCKAFNRRAALSPKKIGPNILFCGFRNCLRKMVRNFLVDMRSHCSRPRSNSPPTHFWEKNIKKHSEEPQSRTPPLKSLNSLCCKRG